MSWCDDHDCPLSHCAEWHDGTRGTGCTSQPAMQNIPIPGRPGREVVQRLLPGSRLQALKSVLDPEPRPWYRRAWDRLACMFERPKKVKL